MAITAAQLMVKVGADTSAAEKGLGAFDAKLKSVASGAGKLGTKLSASVTAPLVGAALVIGKAGVDFESAFTGVIKTVDASEAQLATLRQGIRDMSKELPASAVEIASVAEAAGQLGIQTDAILGFSRVMIDLGETTNLSATQAATDLARMANITGMAQTDFDRLGSTIVALGNNLATTEAEIVAMGMRLAGAGSQIGLTEPQIMGLAGALSSVGIEAEAGGTAISRVMVDIAESVGTGNEKLGQFAEVAGMSVSAFTALFEEDAAAALVTFIEGLGNLDEAGGSVFATLEELGLADIRVRDALLRASGAGDLFRKSLELGTAAWGENIALTDEAALRYGTTASEIDTLRNRLADMAVSLSDALRPMFETGLGMIEQFVAGLERLVAGFATLSPGMQQAILVTLALAAAAGPALLAIAGMAAGVSALGAVLGFLLSPIGLVVAAVAALGVAFATDFMGIRTAVMGVVDTVRPYFEQLLGWIAAASQGDWGPLKQGLQGALQSVKATIESFTWADFVEVIRWADFVTMLQNWGAYIVALPWADYVTKLASWAAYIANLNWSTFVKTLDWASRVRNVVWSEYITKIDWTALVAKLADWYLYIAKLEWSMFVTALDWGGRVAKIVWSEYVMQLDWTAIITKLADWGTWVLLLPWNTFVTLLDWATYVFTLPWGDYVAKLQDWGNHVGGLSWDDYVAKLTEWGTYIANLDWGEYITAIVDWSQWIGNIVWSEFIDNVKWPAALQEFDWTQFIGDVTWATDLGNFDWGDFVSTLEWPEGVLSFSWDTFVDKLTWPFSTRVFSWSTFVPQVQWPWDAIRNFDWGRFIPSFSWPNIGGGGGADENASGTPFFGGGLTWVGERGPELVALPRGARIWSAQDSAAMAGGGGNVTINATVLNEMDIERLAWRIRQEWRRM